MFFLRPSPAPFASCWNFTRVWAKTKETGVLSVRRKKRNTWMKYKEGVFNDCLWCVCVCVCEVSNSYAEIQSEVVRRIKWLPISFLAVTAPTKRHIALTENKWFLMNNCSSLKRWSTSSMSFSILAAVLVIGGYCCSVSALQFPEITCRSNSGGGKGFFFGSFSTIV